jgi:hypothetical protein
MADAVAERAEARQQSCHYQRIGVDHPQFLGIRRVEIMHHARQRRVQHSHVDADHEKRTGDDSQHDPPGRHRNT